MLVCSHLGSQHSQWFKLQTIIIMSLKQIMEKLLIFDQESSNIPALSHRLNRYHQQSPAQVPSLTHNLLIIEQTRHHQHHNSKHNTSNEVIDHNISTLIKRIRQFFHMLN